MFITIKESSSGINIIHFAAYYDNELIKKLLENYPNLLNKLNNKKLTALHFAALSGAKNSASILIDKGANKEARDYLGRTPLYIAAEHENIEVVKLLIDKGCDILAKNNNGQKALYWIIAKCPQLVF